VQVRPLHRRAAPMLQVKGRPVRRRCPRRPDAATDAPPRCCKKAQAPAALRMVQTGRDHGSL
jgi:hypothetical protein